LLNEKLGNTIITRNHALVVFQELH
jgi:hypothetical protein